MKGNYLDIKSRLGKPIWYDQNGCPRYSNDFFNHLPNIHSTLVVRGICICQRCVKDFNVVVGYDIHEVETYCQDIKGGVEYLPEYFNYGDPPRHEDSNGDGCAGSTMSTNGIRNPEYWVRDYIMAMKGFQFHHQWSNVDLHTLKQIVSWKDKN